MAIIPLLLGTILLSDLRSESLLAPSKRLNSLLGASTDLFDP